MCWLGKCDIKIAKRDFYVYKIGYVSDKGFKSLYQNFIYIPKEINKKIKLHHYPYNIYNLATFIIPKGSVYYENGFDEIVSSEIIYTGKYIKL